MKHREKKGYLSLLCVGLGIFCLLSFFAAPKFASAAFQIPDFYYYYSEKIYLNLSTEMITVSFEETISKEKRKDLITADPLLKDISDKPLPFGLVLVATKEGSNKEAITQVIERLNKSPEVKYSTPVFGSGNVKLVLMDQFVVRFKANITEEDIRVLNEENGVVVVRKSPYRHNRYVLRVMNPKDKNAIEIANIYNQDPRVKYATPDFVVIGGYCSTYPDDTYFNQQWALHNIGQDPPGGTPDADVNAPEGWDISTGSSDIVIAILDTGVDLAHEDLVNKLVPGYDAFDDDNDPNPGAHKYNAHGTACAGLAAAETNNGTGVAGVCWNCKIMPIRIASSEYFYWVKEEAAANGITWAANQGADVLSNSWTWHTYSGIIHDAIKEAKNNGRNGKGCILVCAVHNYNDSVEFPATLPETIAVGATNHHDERWDLDCVGLNGCGSNYGPELDVVAPSGWALAGVISWSTDITGPAGYNPGGSEDKGDIAGNYTKWMGGTSGATPKVAGLAGLILSVNPELTSDEVQFIIEDTADDQIGDPLEDTEGWDQYYGWARRSIR